MTKRLIYLLIIVFAACITVEWSGIHSAWAGEHELVSKDKKKKKKKKKKSANAKPQTEKEKAKAKKEEDRKQRKRDKSVAKVQKEREKKNKKQQAEMDKQKPVYNKCDSTDLVRTSKDSMLLVKYLKTYRSLGGVCYIIHLQQMAPIKKTGDANYYVKMKKTSDKREIANWKTYLYCPIGKPNGTVALLSAEGDTIQQCSYQDEKKHGSMIYFGKGGKIAYQEEYINDIKAADIEKEE
ncbi:MAG: hypothetical protein ACK5Z2_04790 [Bacteroidota bacterium]|jgi:hypothetical protein